MSNLKLFLKENKVVKENIKYAATASLPDENGNPVEWEIRPITTTINDDLRDSCTADIPIPGKPGLYRQKLNTSKYIAKLICASVVEPNLYDKELQDSYGVMTPEDLIKQMIDDPGEYNDLAAKIQSLNGFDETVSDKVEKAKN